MPGSPRKLPGSASMQAIWAVRRAKLEMLFVEVAVCYGYLPPLAKLSLPWPKEEAFFIVSISVLTAPPAEKSHSLLPRQLMPRASAPWRTARAERRLVMVSCMVAV